MKYIPYGYHWIDTKDIRAVVKALKADFITQGQTVAEFERRLAAYCGAKYSVAVSSGTAGLHLACLASGIKKGEEVITSPITFVASANCVLYCQARPVFADIQNDTANVGPEEIKRKITAKTRAIIPVHFTGRPCDLKEISTIAKRRGLAVIEDAAHALGAEYYGSKIGSCQYSDMAVVSFHPVKAITTGEGGAVLTNRKDIYEKILMLRNHGITKESQKFIANQSDSKYPWYYEQQLLGFNYRITDFQCALGLSQLRKIDKFIERRRQIVAEYNNFFSRIDGVSVPEESPGSRHSYHIYVVRLKAKQLIANRARIYAFLKSKNILPGLHYIPVYWQPYYRNLHWYKQGLCPQAEKYYSQALTLPLFAKMSQRQIEFIKKNFSQALSRYRK